MSEGEGYMFEDFEVDQFGGMDQQFDCNQYVNDDWQIGEQKFEEIIDFEDCMKVEKIQEQSELKISTYQQQLQIDSDSSEEELDQKTGATRSRSRNKEDPKRKIKIWTQEENDQLINFYAQFNGNWERIAERLIGRTVSQCKQHWQRMNKSQKKKSYWTEEEDQIIRTYINQDENNWAIIAQKLPNRTGKQIRERYINHLRSDIEKKPWTEQEDEKLIQLYSQLGTKWSQIAKHMSGRSEIQIKNRAHKLCKTPRLKLQTHDEIDDYLDLDNKQIETCEKKSPKPKFTFDFSQCQSQTVSSYFKH